MGWKLFWPLDCDDQGTTLDLPALVAYPLRAVAGRIEHTTDLFMHPGNGLRPRVDSAGIARLEFANHLAAAALRRMVHSFREGMTDFEAMAAAAIGGPPLSCHLTFASGDRVGLGLSGLTGQVLRRGSPVSFNIAH